MAMDSTFMRFLFVGAINTLFGYGIFSLFIYVGIHYAIASFLATVTGVLFNFKTMGKIVFNSRDNSLLHRFFGVYGICYVINIASLRVFSIFQVNMFVAGALLIPPLAIISFLLNKKYVFTVRQER